MPLKFRNDPIKSAEITAKILHNNIKRRLRITWWNTKEAIRLALIDYNWGVINNLKRKHLPKTLQEYHTLLKKIYIDYNYVISLYKKNKISHKTFEYKLKQIEKKYFIKKKNGEYYWIIKTNIFKKNVSKKGKIEYWKKHLEDTLINQQFKYPYKLYWAKTFFEYLKKM